MHRTEVFSTSFYTVQRFPRKVCSLNTDTEICFPYSWEAACKDNTGKHYGITGIRGHLNESWSDSYS